jgi:hypothetical protein
MTPALEYAIRKNIVKDLLVIPCSLFLKNNCNDKKIVITIDEEFKKSNHFSVKHWNLESCTKDQALPGMIEFRVPKEEIFYNKSVIVPGYEIKYIPEIIKVAFNHYKPPVMRPMSAELYNYLLENTFSSIHHDKYRINWLWSRFKQIYLKDFQIKRSYIHTIFNDEDYIFTDERYVVKTTMKKEWRYWQMWQKYLFLQNPAELIFAKEYSL